jgi:hypothetical protein
VTLQALQPEAVDLLDATIARGASVVDPSLLEGVRQRIAHLVADGPQPRDPVDAQQAAVFAVIEQMLIDVSALDDETVRRAAAPCADGVLADLVMTSYAIEAQTRLTIAADRLLGGYR